MKRIAMVIAHNGFRDEEYFEPKATFMTGGFEVRTVSSLSAPATSKFGVRVDVDMVLDDLRVDEFDAIVFVGGPGTIEYTENPQAHAIATTAYEKGKLVGAICMAPVILANAGLLRGKRATVFPSDAATIQRQGATFVEHNIVIDGSIITGCGPEAAEEFGRVVAEQLQKV